MRHLVAIIAVIGVLLSACSATILELEIGTCFDDPENLKQVEDVPVVGCEEPHDNEVIANVKLTGSAYPGRDQAENRASQISTTRSLNMFGFICAVGSGANRADSLNYSIKVYSPVNVPSGPASMTAAGRLPLGSWKETRL